MKTFKERLAANEVIRVFALGRLVQPLLVEMYGLAGGYHGVWIDQEHVTHSTPDLAAVALAARANEMDSFVRMAPTGYSQVTQCLEAGMGGVMAAQIHTAEQAAEFLSWTKFAPQGTRGLNSGGRDANYSHMPAAEFIEHSNRESFVAIQVETLGSVDEAEEIAALEGVDLLFVGPADLSLALGVVGQFHHEKLWEAISKVAQACEKHGKHWGAVVPDPEFADKAVEMGCRMPTMGNDVITIRRGIDTIKSAFSSQFE